MSVENESELADNQSELMGAFALFRPSWQAVRSNVEAFTVQIVTPFMVLAFGAALYFLGRNLHLHYVWEAASIITLLIGAVLFFAIVPGLIYTQFKGVQGETVRYGEVLASERQYIWRMWGLILLLTILIAGGLCLLIVPGLFAWQRFLYAPYILLDKHLGPIASLRASAKLAKRYSYSTWDLIGVQMLLGVPSLLIPILGSLVSAGLDVAYYCAPAARYWEIRSLQGESVTTEPHEQTQEHQSARTKKKSTASP